MHTRKEEAEVDPMIGARVSGITTRQCHIRVSHKLTKTSKEILLETNTWEWGCIIDIVLSDHEVAPRLQGAPELFIRSPSG